MRDIQVSRPALIALIGAILVGGFLFFKSKGSESAPPPPVPAAAATGATGATGGTGGTGASGPTMSAAEIRAQKAKLRRAALVAAAQAAGMPVSVFEPLQQGKIVLILFYTKGGQDDAHVQQAVDEVSKERGSSMKVIREPVSHKSRYDGIAKAGDITQTPGIIILYGDQADSWQGYIDGAALNVRITRLSGQS